MALNAPAFATIFVFALGFVSPIAIGQITRTEITADTGRPVAEAIQLLQSRHPGVVITYEDPRYSFANDLEDVTQQVRRDLHLFPSGRAPKVIVPAGSPLQFDYVVSAETGDPLDWKDSLDRIVATFQAGGYGGRFGVVQVADTYHVVPVEVRNANGEWVAQQSVLDAAITLNQKDVSGFELLSAITDDVIRLTGERVTIGTIPPNLFGNYRGSLEADNEPARRVLLRLLADVMEGTTSRLTWQIFYGPDVKYYALNIHAS